MPVYVHEFTLALPRDIEEQVHLTLPRYTRVIDGSLMLGDEPGTAVFHGYVVGPRGGDKLNVGA